MVAPAGGALAPVTRVGARGLRIPTDAPEPNGTLAWDATTMVLVEVEAADAVGTGWSYTDASAADVVGRVLAPVIRGTDAFAVEAAWVRMGREVRNMGRPGIVATAISAVDLALWDLKARLLGLPRARPLGQVRDAVPSLILTGCRDEARTVDG